MGADGGAVVEDTDRVAHASAARDGVTIGQTVLFTGLLAFICCALLSAPTPALACAVVGLQAIFVLTSVWRFTLAIASLAPIPQAPALDRWPRYTILAALHDEADVAPQLIGNLSRLDYPEHRLEGFLVLEAHDAATLAAIEATPRPAWLHVMIAPPGAPQTKPRALNFALSRASGALLTIYDAEDAPDPGQLREAASRFMHDPELGCLQAPLRIRDRSHLPRSGFLDRQFALEYASLFEVTLRGMARLALPFPLGGTSNHIRVSALRQAGGWDAYNVTEDADLGFRLWRNGWRLGVIARPTLETPPGGFDRWLPQRTRWLKGYMQTWGVHTRQPLGLGARGLAAFVMTVGMAIVSALAHAPALAWLTAAVLIGLSSGLSPGVPIPSVGVLLLGAIAAWMGCAVGARRAGLGYTLSDMACAPAYWALLSVAFVHAVWRLATQPFVWDKTPHDRDRDRVETVDDAGREAA